MGVFGLTAADHLISPAIMQALGQVQNPTAPGAIEVKSKVFSKLRPQKSELDGDRRQARCVL
jgi:hypothetical protein